MKKLIKWIGLVIVGMVILVFLFVITASQFGWRFDLMAGKSMEPTYDLGGMMVTRPAAMEEIKIGDPILFRELVVEEEDVFTCHRVIEIKEIDKELYFQTKGDANEYPDFEWVSSENFHGRAIFYIPQIGKIAYSTQLHKAPVTIMGKEISVAFLIIVALGLILIGTELRNIWGWMTNPYLKRRQEILKKRKERKRT